MSKPAGNGAESMWAPYVLEYPYKRSVGPVLGRFFGGLKSHRIQAVKTADGRVICPPLDYDPQTGDALGKDDDWVEVGPAGVVKTWAWVAMPRPKHPLQTPFAWALIQLDGASSAMLHAVSAPSEGVMKSGMRVRARWRDNTVGDIRDIACFEPEAD